MRELTHEDRAQLHRDMLAGCEEAYTLLYMEAWRLMHEAARRIDFMEYTYEFYSKIPELLRGWKPEVGPLSMTICRRFTGYAAAERRRVGHAPYVNVDERVLEKLFNARYGNEEAPDDSVAVEALYDALRALIEDNWRQARVIMEYYMHGCTYTDIGIRMGITPAGASHIAGEGIKYLKKKMTAALNEPPPLDGGDEEKFNARDIWP